MLPNTLSDVTVLGNWPLTMLLLVAMGYIGTFMAQYSGLWTLRLVAPFAMIDFWFSGAAINHPTPYELANLAFIQCTWWLGLVMTIVTLGFLLGSPEKTQTVK